MVSTCIPMQYLSGNEYLLADAPGFDVALGYQAVEAADVKAK